MEMFGTRAITSSAVAVADGTGWMLPVALGTVGLLVVAYWTIALVIARRLAYARPLPVEGTPAAAGLDFRAVDFPSRDDGLRLRGWLIPGVRPDGSLTLERTVIAAHGAWQNRTDPAMGLYDLCCALARAGFAVLTFDLRGHGESDPAPFMLGYREQRDVLGAADFLRSDELPYPELERPRWIAGYGVSVGANALLYAAVAEPDIRAVVADSAHAEVATILVREVSRQSRLPKVFAHGALFAARLLYGVNVAAIRPVEAVAGIAPRPLLLIQGGADGMIPRSSLTHLAKAAQAHADAHVAAWRVPGAEHAQAFHHEGEAYVTVLESFYRAACNRDIRPDASEPGRIAS